MTALERVKNGRSFLFVPGSRPDRFDKACASGADVVLLDCEDACAPGEKDSARGNVRAFLRGRPGAAGVRINGFSSPWFSSDLDALREVQPVCIAVPKAESAAAFDLIARALPEVALFPIVETAHGIQSLAEVTTAPNVMRVAFGALDFEVDVALADGSPVTSFARSALILASRVASLPSPIDGVTTAIDDAECLARDIAQSVRYGFGGKFCIHPKQVAKVNTGFMPSDEDVRWASRVLAATNDGSLGVAVVDGKMVDAPVIRKAQAVIARSSLIK